MPCPKCGVEVSIPLLADDAGRGFHAPTLIDVMNEHVVGVHEIPTSGM